MAKEIKNTAVVFFTHKLNLATGVVMNIHKKKKPNIKQMLERSHIYAERQRQVALLILRVSDDFDLIPKTKPKTMDGIIKPRGGVFYEL